MTTLEALQRSPLFKDFSPASQETLAEIARERSIKAGAVLFEEDAPGDSLFVVAAGTLKLTRKERAGPKELATLGPGEHVGDLGLLARTVHLVSAVAATDCTILELSRRAFFKKAQEKPLTCLKLAAVVAGEVARRAEASHAALRALGAG